MQVFTLSIFASLSMAFSSPMPLPLMGWSTWNTFGCAINDTLVKESIEALATSPLRSAGYNYVLIDDCWTTCDKLSTDGNCEKPGTRDSRGRIQVNPTKFPNGFQSLTALAHSKNLKIGIYTSVSPATCAGYMGSWMNEEIDAQTFVDWGFDFVKHDTCGSNYGVHDGGLQNATIRMREGLYKAGQGKIVYYLDNGNPTSPQRVFNPYQRWVKDQSLIQKEAIKPSELVWVWASQFSDGKGPHFFKSWYDMNDSWQSTLDNVHNQIRIAEYQKCGQLNTPDMMTVGMGKQSQGQYRAQFFLWSILGAPLIMGNDIRVMDSFTIALLTNKEILAVDQDVDCVQGSLAKALGATEVWIKPLHNNSFAVVLLNKGDAPTNVTLDLSSDFDPADFDHIHVRDLYAQKDIGTFRDTFTTSVPALDATIIIATPFIPKI